MAVFTNFAATLAKRPAAASLAPRLNQLTVWKFHDFSITQILREINFGDSRSAKYAILTYLEALNFGFY